MRKLRIANFKAYLGPGSEYEKIIKASEKAASNVQELIDHRLYSFDSLKILCSRYMNMKTAAERVLRKNDNGLEAKKDCQRALRVIGDTFGQQLEYYAGDVVRSRIEYAGGLKKEMKNRTYSGRLPKPSWVDGIIDDIKGIKIELDKAGINSKSVSKHVNAGVEKTERIKKQLEDYHQRWQKYS